MPHPSKALKLNVNARIGQFPSFVEEKENKLGQLSCLSTPKFHAPSSVGKESVSVA
jgi:hypothetical protein